VRSVGFRQGEQNLLHTPAKRLAGQVRRARDVEDDPGERGLTLRGNDPGQGAPAVDVHRVGEGTVEVRPEPRAGTVPLAEAPAEELGDPPPIGRLQELCEDGGERARRLGPGLPFGGDGVEHRRERGRKPERLLEHPEEPPRLLALDELIHRRADAQGEQEPTVARGVGLEPAEDLAGLRRRQGPDQGADEAGASGVGGGVDRRRDQARS
jgi:hypothetical protein